MGKKKMFFKCAKLEEGEKKKRGTAKSRKDSRKKRIGEKEDMQIMNST